MRLGKEIHGEVNLRHMYKNSPLMDPLGRIFIL